MEQHTVQQCLLAVDRVSQRDPAAAKVCVVPLSKFFISV